MAKKSRKVVPVRRINFITIIFIVIVIYLIAIGIQYTMKEKIKVYEVVEGSLATDSSFTGIILRNEEVVKSQSDGFLKCYVRNGDVIGLNQSLYALDANKESTNTDTISNNSLSTDNLTLLKGYMTSYSINYDSNTFDDIYTFKTQLQSVVNEIAVESTNTDESNLAVVKSKKSGIVMFVNDGYEDLTTKKITKETFDKSTYKANYLLNGNEVKSSQPVAKLITGQDWQIVVPLTKEQVENYSDIKKVSVSLKNINCTTDAKLEIITNNDENYGVLSLKRYMASYLNNRYIDIEISSVKDSGLKVPISSVITRDFYIIPESYVQKDEESNSYGVYLRDSNDLVSYKDLEIYNLSDGYYYIDKSLFKQGDTLAKSEKSKKSYTIGKTKSLKGVYNVNQGYAIFNEVQIIDGNDEYYIVKSGDNYGLKENDRIVLNAVSVDEEQFLY